MHKISWPEGYYGIMAPHLIEVSKVEGVQVRVLVSADEVHRLLRVPRHCVRAHLQHNLSIRNSDKHRAAQIEAMRLSVIECHRASSGAWHRVLYASTWRCYRKGPVDLMAASRVPGIDQQVNSFKTTHDSTHVRLRQSA